MDDVEEQILSYPQLPEVEKQAVEAYVEDHPEWAPLLRDVRALESAARNANVDPAAVDNPLLGAYVVDRHLESDVEASALADLFEILERRMDDDDALRERVDAESYETVDRRVLIVGWEPCTDEPRSSRVDRCDVGKPCVDSFTVRLVAFTLECLLGFEDDVGSVTRKVNDCILCIEYGRLERRQRPRLR